MTSDPPRLKDGADAPRELSAVLDALRRGSADSARVARVAAKLGPLLDAPPPVIPPALRAEPSALPSRVGLHSFKALRLFVAGMAVGASVLWLSGWPRQQPASPPPAAPREEMRASATVANGELARRNLPPSTSAAVAHAERLTFTNGEGGNPRSEPSSTAPSRARSGRASAASVSPVRANTRSTSTRARSALGTARATSATSASAAAPIEPASQQLSRPPAEPEQPAQPRPEPPKSEVELLFEARTLRQRAPREALALLDQHASRFADGMLAPEREAMAIEILRALGQTQQADQRLARYRARYPNSLHLPRLEKAR